MSSRFRFRRLPSSVPIGEGWARWARCSRTHRISGVVVGRYFIRWRKPIERVI